MSSEQPNPTTTSDWRLHFGSLSQEAKHTVKVLLLTARKSGFYKLEEILSNLTDLNLENNQISDLKPLQSLTNLTNLNLGNNQISDLTPLQSLTNLIELNLENNQISDLTPLHSLTSLKYLNLFHNQIVNLTPLKSLTCLTNLNLSQNQISDLTPLKSLTCLINLNLDNNQISDLTPLKSLTILTYLNLDNNQISNLTPLKSLVTNLTYLNLSHNHISDLKPLQSVTNLNNLNLVNNQISDLKPLQSLTSLKYLNLDNNQISDLTLLQSLTNLIELNLDNNQISDITPLHSLIDLKKLSLPNNLLSDLTPLQYLWKAIANSTERVDRTRAAAAIEFAYTALGKTCPKIIFCSSPHSAITQLKKLKSPTNKNDFFQRIYKQLEPACLPFRYILFLCLYYFALTSEQPQPKTAFFQLIYEQLESAYRPFNLIRYSSSYLPQLIEWERQLTQELQHDFWDYCRDNSTSIVNRASLWDKICVADFCVSVLRIVLNPDAQKAFECLKQLLVECGWIFAFDKVCYVCDRPLKLSLDSEHRPHAEGESAIEFSDGYKLYSYHGVTLPAKYGQIHPNQWESTWILEEENAELRRVLIQGIG
ncbi:leucine-rich repeat domain-containing protein [Microcoleus sp. K1-B6]|uniref:leucine-rich repeat domain-containing protein n=1 Tax=unclassified Microcoleus TaxID=2642155 RepID=UPI002FD3A08F